MSCVIAYISYNDTTTTEICTLSLHDALPIWNVMLEILRPVLERLHAQEHTAERHRREQEQDERAAVAALGRMEDRKSTRLNSSHEWISYAVFCLKKKNAVTYTK